MVLTFLTPNMITKLPSPTKVKEKGLNSQTKFQIKTYYIGCYLPSIYSVTQCPMSLCTVYWLEKIFIKHFFFFFTFASWCPTVRLKHSQPTYLDSISHCTAFPFGKHPDGTFRHVQRRRLPCFQGEKFQMGMQQIKFQWHVTAHSSVMLELAGTISLWFSSFSLPRKFLQTFSNALQAFPSVEFNFVLKSWSSKSFIYQPMHNRVALKEY